MPPLAQAKSKSLTKITTINGSNVINHGTLNAHELNFIDARRRILNKADLNSATDIKARMAVGYSITAVSSLMKLTVRQEPTTPPQPSSSTIMRPG